MNLKSNILLTLVVLTFLTSSAHAQLIAHWKLNGDLTDSAGDNDGVFFGADEPTFVKGPDGSEGSAVLFDGVDDYIQIPDITDPPQLVLTDNFTLALWFKPASTDQTDTYLLSRNGGGGQYAIIYEYTDNKLDFFAPSRNFGDDPRAGGMSEMPLDDTGWHHIVYTYDGAVWAGYMDGEPVFTVNIVFALSDTFVAPWWIGAANDHSSFVNGAIADVRIYREALDEAGVAELYFEPVETTCPEEGDTHVTDLLVEGPEDNTIGDYQLTATAVDDSADAIYYTFVLDDGMGSVITVGPQPASTAIIALTAGVWNISVTVDDDPLCEDVAEDAQLNDQVEVFYAPMRLAHWAFNGDLVDSEGTSDGIFFGDIEPLFVDGHDGTPDGAIYLDGVDDYVQIEPTNFLAISDTFTLALWFKSERMDQNETYLLSRNDSIPGGSGKQIAVIYEYDDNQVDFYAPSRLFGDDPRAGGMSLMSLDDTEWHHIAYTYDGETWAGYMDGNQVFSHAITFELDDTFASSWWIGAANYLGNFVNGAIDDVCIYNYGLTGEEVTKLVNGNITPGGTKFIRGDSNVDSAFNLADAISTLSYLFAAGPPPKCFDAADVNDSGKIDLADAISLLSYLFSDGPDPAIPFGECGIDPTEDDLNCEAYDFCE